MSDTQSNQDKNPGKEVLFHGIPASPGIAMGEVKLSGPISATTKTKKAIVISPDRVEEELRIFGEAREQTKAEILEMQKRMQIALPEKEAGIFDAHLLIVDDRMLNSEVTALIREKLIPADAAFEQVIRKYITVISGMSDSYLKERADDVKDVAARMMRNLNGLERPLPARLSKPVVIIARDLTPSDTAMLDRDNVLGFAIERGSRTSHTALLARSLKIPAVVGMQHFFERLSDGDEIILDGYLGIVIVHPTEETRDFYRTKLERKEKLERELLQESGMRAETLDGYCIRLAANTEGLNTLADLQKYGAEGIGLFRTEYLYLKTHALPSEEQQFNVYKELVEKMPGRPVVIRTFDLGGDKLNANLNAEHEPNPFLGQRAIRLCHDRPALIRTQMRAILRASAFGDLKILFPMVSSADELDRILEMLQAEKDRLKEERIAFNARMEVGIMIEIPSAAIIAKTLAEKVDFFSIGTNDLTQYTLAVDRGNQKVAYLYKPGHAAVLSLIRETTEAAREAGIHVCVCGEIAGDPVYAPLLIGLGVQELSMSAASLGMIRRVIRRMKLHEAEELAQQALHSRTASETQALATEFVRNIAPDLVS